MIGIAGNLWDSPKMHERLSDELPARASGIICTTSCLRFVASWWLGNLAHVFEMTYSCKR